MYAPPPQQEGMSTGVKVGIAVGVLVVLYLLFKDKVDAALKPLAAVTPVGPTNVVNNPSGGTTAVTPALVTQPVVTPLPSPRRPKWMFYQGKDSGGNDIGNFPGSLEQIKAKCESLPNCKGFNDNGWIKHTLSMSALTSGGNWTSDPNKGFRVHADRVPEAPSVGVPEYE